MRQVINIDQRAPRTVGPIAYLRLICLDAAVVRVLRAHFWLPMGYCRVVIAREEFYEVKTEWVSDVHYTPLIHPTRCRDTR